MVELELLDVRIDESSRAPIMEFRPKDDSHRLFTIMIGVAEATAIKQGMTGRTPPRPMTHDLLIDALHACNASIEKVVITELAMRVFHAELHVMTPSGPSIVTCRPSDGVAVAIRVAVPVFANSELLDECAVPDLAALVNATESGEPEVLFDEFRKFIDDLNPDDFQE